MDKGSKNLILLYIPSTFVSRYSQSKIFDVNKIVALSCGLLPFYAVTQYYNVFNDYVGFYYSILIVLMLRIFSRQPIIQLNQSSAVAMLDYIGVNTSTSQFMKLISIFFVSILGIKHFSIGARILFLHICQLNLSSSKLFRNTRTILSMLLVKLGISITVLRSK